VLKIEVKDFPATVIVDNNGTDLYISGKRLYTRSDFYETGESPH
jgi:tartrate dehydratase beta subunit/fumarate hydratase class I family protein